MLRRSALMIERRMNWGLTPVGSRRSENRRAPFRGLSTRRTIDVSMGRGGFVRDLFEAILDRIERLANPSSVFAKYCRERECEEANVLNIRGKVRSCNRFPKLVIWIIM